MAQTEVMPAVEQQRIGKLGDPCIMVIFGASGDLTRRKLIPALYNLAKNDLLSREFAVIGVSRSPLSHEDFRKKASEDIKQFATDKVDPDIWERFVRGIYYLSGDMGDKDLYLQLKDLLDKVDRDHSTHGNHMYYLATAAEFFGAWIAFSGRGGLSVVSPDGKSTRVLQDESWMAFTWSADSERLFGIRQSDDFKHLTFTSVDVRSRAEHVLGADVRPLPVAFQPVRGLTRVSPTTFLASIARVQSDVWLLEGFDISSGIRDGLGALFFWRRTAPTL